MKLAAGAPPAGVSVTLVSSDPSKVTVSPGTLLIPAGNISVAAQVTGVNFGSATITASAPGVQGDAQTVQVAETMSFSQSNVSIYGGVAPPNFTLNLSVPAPAGGVSVALNSSVPGVATVPASITVPAGFTSAPVVITPVSPGATVLTATAAGLGTATATVGVSELQIGVASNVTVGVGQSASLPVSLAALAPPGGVTITLTSSDPSKVTVSPSTVHIPLGGSTSAAPQVTGVSIGSATITASAPGWTAGKAVVSVPATLNFSPSTISINASSTQNLNLCLSSTAPTGITINLSSANTAVATVPSTVNIPQGQKCTPVPVTGAGNGSTVIHASSLPAIPDTTASVTVSSVGSIALSGNTALTAGQSTPLTVTLSVAAPSTVTVALTSSDTSKATVSPSSVVIGAGQKQPATQPQITGAGGGSATITASASGWVPGTLGVQVTGASIQFSPTSATITGSQNFTLCSSSAAPAGGATYNVASSKPSVATVPATVAISGGQTCTNVLVTGVSSGTAVITATGGGATATANVTVVNAINLPANVVLTPGQSTQFPVTLGSPAPAGGIFVTLTSSDPSKVSVSPTNILIPTGGTSYSFVTVTGGAVGSATITASAFGLPSTSQVVQVSTTGGGTGNASFSPTSITITGTGTQNLTLNLSGPAPAGLVATLTSGNSAVATVPATVAFTTGANSVTVPVTGVASGATTVNATVPGFGTASANVSVSSTSNGIVVPANTTVPPGQSVPFPVSLSAPAPAGGVFITLTSSNPSKLTVLPANILILQGATTPTSTPQLTGVAAGSATISASANGYPTAVGQVLVASSTSMSFAPSSATITGKATVNLALTLPAPRTIRWPGDHAGFE